MKKMMMKRKLIRKGKMSDYGRQGVQRKSLVLALPKIARGK